MHNLEITFNTSKQAQIVDESHEFVMSIRNTGPENVNGTVCIQAPLHAQSQDLQEIVIRDLASQASLEVSLAYKFSQAGRHTFYIWQEGAKLASLTKHYVFIHGAGYYSGDVHNHTQYSDGKNTLSENRAAMLEKGHSFLYSTDHNTLDHKDEIEGFRETDTDFLHILGWEFTSGYGHALAYNSQELYAKENITGHNNLSEWQSFIDNYPEPSFVFLAHPYEAAKYEFGQDVLDNIQGIAGIEVWNGFNHHALVYQNQQAFRLWDSMNLRGTQKFVGNAVSDAHSADKVGNPFIKGFMNELTDDEVHNMMQSGRFFGSNGPEIEFSLNGQGMGETLEIASKSDYVDLDLRVFDPLGGLESVLIFKGKIGVDKRFKKIKEVFFIGDQDKSNYHLKAFIPVEKGEIYRVEVVSKVGAVTVNSEADSYDRGFAYSNPIWVG